MFFSREILQIILISEMKTERKKTGNRRQRLPVRMSLSVRRKKDITIRSPRAARTYPAAASAYGDSESDDRKTGNLCVDV